MFTVRSSIALGIISVVLGSRLGSWWKPTPSRERAAQSVADLDRTILVQF